MAPSSPSARIRKPMRLFVFFLRATFPAITASHIEAIADLSSRHPL
jgi:hypothetical protein